MKALRLVCVFFSCPEQKSGNFCWFFGDFFFSVPGRSCEIWDPPGMAANTLPVMEKKTLVRILTDRWRDQDQARVT